MYIYHLACKIFLSYRQPELLALVLARTADTLYIVQVSDVSKLLIVSGLPHKNQKHWGGRPHVILLIQKMWLAGTVQNTFILRKSKKCFFNSFNRLCKPAEKKKYYILGIYEELFCPTRSPNS